MSKAYYFAKNFTFNNIISLLCYSTHHPEKLTSIQKVTRLYRYNVSTFIFMKYSELI